MLSDFIQPPYPFPCIPCSHFQETLWLHVHIPRNSLAARRSQDPNQRIRQKLEQLGSATGQFQRPGAAPPTPRGSQRGLPGDICVCVCVRVHVCMFMWETREFVCPLSHCHLAALHEITTTSMVTSLYFCNNPQHYNPQQSTTIHDNP